MKYVAIDTETHLIVDNNVPAPICLTKLSFESSFKLLFRRSG